MVLRDTIYMIARYHSKWQTVTVGSKDEIMILDNENQPKKLQGCNFSIQKRNNYVHYAKPDHASTDPGIWWVDINLFPRAASDWDSILSIPSRLIGLLVTSYSEQTDGPTWICNYFLQAIPGPFIQSQSNNIKSIWKLIQVNFRVT